MLKIEMNITIFGLLHIVRRRLGGNPDDERKREERRIG